ncbi:hypothetical protein ACLMJK_009266 [Lecanora helva]
METPSVPSRDFFRDKVLFVTGATGFLGLALTVKLLRDVPCRKLYLLVRGGERHFWDYYRQVLSPDQLQSIHAKSEIIILDGNLTKPRLGLQDDQISKLKDQVDVYIHLACSINLRRSLAEIAQSIIDPTLELAKIALASSFLERFVYISTAYANSHLHHLHHGIDTEVSERVYSLRSGDGDSTELEFRDFCISGTTPEYKCHNFPFPYAYAKHLTERLLLRLFDEERRSESLLIVRPSILGPALKEPYPYYEARGSAPATNFLAAAVATLSQRLTFSSRFNNPLRDSTLDEVPVDIVVNRILIHISMKSEGVVHAVVGAPGRRTFQSLWERAMSERRLPWQPRLVWKDVDWHSPLLHDIAHASVIMGTSYLFEDARVNPVWSKMTNEERVMFPLFMNSAEELGEVVKRRRQVRGQLERWFSRKGLPLIFIDLLIGRPISLRDSSLH